MCNSTLFHIRHKPNISLKPCRNKLRMIYTPYGVIGMREHDNLLNCFIKYDIMHVKSWFYHQEREVTE